MTRRYDSQEVRRRTISAGIKLFIEKGYHKTTVSDICRLADVSNGSFFNVFRTKNGLLMELVVNMFNGPFDAADSLLPADSEPHMLYVFETAIQLAIAETSENLRDIYVEAYTNRETLCYIHDRTAARLFELFRPFNPDWSESRCFETEIGTAAVMSGYMRYPCNRYFTFEQKLERFLDIALKAYNVPEAMRSDAIERIKAVDIRNYAVRVIRKLAESVEFEHDLSLNGESV